MNIAACAQRAPLTLSPWVRLVVVVALLTLASAPAAAQSRSRSLEALVIDERVALDGHLDEPFWQRAAVATGFEQRNPDTGAPATERTEVRVARDGDRLYVGVMAFDSAPGSIVAKEMQRDGSGSFGGFRGVQGAYGNDDSIIIVLDTFLDRRNAFYFETNPNGARADALIENERNPDFEWDGVWTVAARRTPDGWSAELSIPFSTLRFDPDNDTWGLNIRRLIRRNNEEALWAPVGRDANLPRMSLAGDLTGMGGLQPGVNLRAKPFGVASSGRDFETPADSPGEDFDGGLDLLRWGVTNNMTLDLTANTDFAQAEADDERINLTRFSLFFPEKREFFLENAGIFNFGPSRQQGGGMRAPLLRMFFSRRIGLDEGGIIPLRVGARFTGRGGGWNFGLMDVQTSAVSGLGDDGDIDVGATNWGVARVKRNIGERSSIGAIYTNKQVSGDQWNRVAGIDVDFNPSRRVNLTGFFAASRDKELGSDAVTDWAGGAGFNYRGRVLRARASITEIRDNFRPEMGFLLRDGIRRYDYNVDFEPRPANNLGVRNLTFSQRTGVVTLSDGTVETVDSTFRFFGFDTRAGDRVSVFASYNFERLFEDFEIQDGIFIPSGDYKFTDVGVFLRTDGSRPVSFFGFYTKGSFFGGTRFMGNSTLTLRLSRLLSAETAWSYNNVDLPGGSFKASVLRQRFKLAFSPDLFWNTLVQYNSSSDLLTLNSRLNWIYRPGADIFLVYNQDWGTGTPLRPLNRAIILKFTYLIML